MDCHLNWGKLIDSRLNKLNAGLFSTGGLDCHFNIRFAGDSWGYSAIHLFSSLLLSNSRGFTVDWARSLVYTGNTALF